MLKDPDLPPTAGSATSDLKIETRYAVTLNDSNSVPLKSIPKVYLIAGQIIKIHEGNPLVANERYRAQMLSYVYGFTTQVDGKEVELMTFQWNREPDASSDYPPGHLHIGPGLLSNAAAIRPRNFHKAHVPTERLSYESIVRFAIIELGVRPESANWRPALEASERHSRKGEPRRFLSCPHPITIHSSAGRSKPLSSLARRCAQCRRTTDGTGQCV